MNNIRIDRKEIKHIVKDIINQFVEQDVFKTREEDILLMDVDSLVVMDIILKIEKDLNISRITDQEVFSMETFDHMMCIIYKKLNIA